jgi:hypothetical protein
MARKEKELSEITDKIVGDVVELIRNHAPEKVGALASSGVVRDALEEARDRYVRTLASPTSASTRQLKSLKAAISKALVVLAQPEAIAQRVDRAPGKSDEEVWAWWCRTMDVLDDANRSLQALRDLLHTTEHRSRLGVSRRTLVSLATREAAAEFVNHIDPGKSWLTFWHKGDKSSRGVGVVVDALKLIGIPAKDRQIARLKLAYDDFQMLAPTNHTQ